MTQPLASLWAGFATSIPGSGHIRRGLPCQDASATILSPRPALIVCDGRGSAQRSQEGAQGAISSFKSQIAIFEPMLESILDQEEDTSASWEQFSRILYRTLMQVKLDLAEKENLPEKEFDFTVALAIVGHRKIGCFQVGDGAIVLRQQGELATAFLPDKGEFANQTHFLRENGERSRKFHARLFSVQENSGVAVTSDGPEHLMFSLTDMKPGPIFDRLLNDLQANALSPQDIRDYLTRPCWAQDSRGSDDRSLAILAPRYSSVVSKEEEERDMESPATPPPANSPKADSNLCPNLDKQPAEATPPHPSDPTKGAPHREFSFHPRPRFPQGPKPENKLYPRLLLPLLILALVLLSTLAIQIIRFRQKTPPLLPPPQEETLREPENSEETLRTPPPESVNPQEMAPLPIDTPMPLQEGNTSFPPYIP